MNRRTPAAPNDVGGTGALQSAGRPNTTISAATDNTAAATPTVNLATIPEPYYRAYIAGYGEGACYGYKRALDDLDVADQAAWAELSERVRKQANQPRFSKLCDLRGESDKAERARERERGNGLDLAS